jgi:SAM-dependent methyltransferase
MVYGPQSVLDAGCGTGRVAIELAARGVQAVGVDVDATMIAAARGKAPGLRFEVADLASLDLGRAFDLVVMAGNVPVFVVPTSRAASVQALSAHLHGDGLLVAGFTLDATVGGSGDPVGLTDYDRWCAAADLELVERFDTWDGAAFSGGTYAVSVHRKR